MIEAAATLEGQLIAAQTELEGPQTNICGRKLFCEFDPLKARSRRTSDGKSR